MPKFVSYDIRGIQRFIFAVPQLKYIVGGSSLIDEVDRDRADSIADELRVGKVFAGGGKGTFAADAADVDALVDRLKEEVHSLGLDLRLSTADSLEEVVKATSQKLYPYMPDSLEGEPCSASGMFPVTRQTGRGFDGDTGVHPVVWKRVEAAREDKLGRRLESLMKSLESFPDDLREYQIEFLRNVSPEAGDSGVELARAQAGAAALGAKRDRNARWAVVVADGNDMGAQIKHAKVALDKQAQQATSAEHFNDWLQAMSTGIDWCTSEAVAEATNQLLSNWWKRLSNTEKESVKYDDGGTRCLMVPVRPLIVGGDDIVILVEARSALSLVCDLSNAFTAASERLHRSHKMSPPLWGGTGGQLTLSAGVAFLNVKFPLHTGIQIAESLIASAKAKMRKRESDGKPTPASVDWEEISESAIDNLGLRRHRTLFFEDEDLEGTEGKAVHVKLTRRPYLISDVESGQLNQAMEKVKKVPRSIRQRLLSGLYQPHHQRQHFISKISRNHEPLAKALRDDLPKTKAAAEELAKEYDGVLSTSMLDACNVLDQLPEGTHNALANRWGSDDGG